MAQGMTGLDRLRYIPPPATMALLKWSSPSRLGPSDPSFFSSLPPATFTHFFFGDPLTKDGSSPEESSLMARVGGDGDRRWTGNERGHGSDAVGGLYGGAKGGNREGM